MKARKNIIINTVYNLLSGTVSYPFTIIAAAIITRSLSTENYGIYALALTYGNLSLRIASIGLLPGCNTYMMREISKDSAHNKTLIPNIILLEICILAISSLVSIVAVKFLYSGAMIREVLTIAILYSILISMSAIFDYIFQSYEVMKYRWYLKLLKVSTTLILLLCWWKYVGGLLNLFYLYIALELFLFIVYVGFCQRKLHIWQWSAVAVNEWWGIARKSFFFAINSQLLLLLAQLDIILLSWLATSKEIAFYNIAYVFITAGSSLASAIGWALFPVLSRIQNKNGRVLPERHYAPLLKALMSAAVFICVFYIAFSDDFIPLIYGVNYEPSAPLLKVLSIGIMFSFISVVLVSYLNTGGHEKRTAVSLVLAVIANILLNIILIPRYNAMGAAIATIVAEGIVCIAYWVYVSKTIFKLEKKFQYVILREWVIFAFIVFLLLAVGANFSIKALLVLSIFPLQYLAGVFPDEIVSNLRSMVRELLRGKINNEI